MDLTTVTPTEVIQTIIVATALYVAGEMIYNKVKK